MNINSRDNFINQLTSLNNDEITNVDLSFYLVKKQKEADNFYLSLEKQLAPDVNTWFKSHIIEELKELKTTNHNDEFSFNVAEYNFEIQKNDHIAKLNLNSIDQLLQRKQGLINALCGEANVFSEDLINFQIVKMSYNDSSAYFCFYRGTKKNTSKKKYVMKNTNQLHFVENSIIDVGGKIDFFIFDDFVFILNVTNFEYAFDYRDHINRARDQNINQIIALPFFNGDASNADVFAEKCKTFIYSRSLAQISPSTIDALQTQFIERCNELSIIKSALPEEPALAEIYKTKFGSLWNLFDYLDLENHQIKYDEDSSPTPLIHFFADKIVKSFLTEDFKVASGYE